MRIAVLDMEWTGLPPQVTGLDGYSGALALIRIGGRPVGQSLFPVCGGRLEGTDLRHLLACGADSAFWEAWLEDYLNIAAPRPAPAKIPPATVAVCTRDRAEDLEKCIDSLGRLADDGQEILVVDNAPATDDTRALVSRYPHIRYVREDHPGLDFARNRALDEARHGIVAFTDDDAVVDPLWLRMLLRNFDDPRVVCVTGSTMPIELETRAQIAFQRAGGLGRGFKRAVYDRTSLAPAEAWKVGAGVNTALRRDAVIAIGAYDPCLDVGTPVAGGGDTDMYRRLLLAGHRLVYDPEALVWHRHRSTWESLRRQVYGYESAGFAVLARALLFEGRLDALRSAWDWVKREPPNIVAALIGLPGRSPRDLALARLRGALVGPWAYLYARWKIRNFEKAHR